MKQMSPSVRAKPTDHLHGAAAALRLGILGDGQLAMMLTAAAAKLGYATTILSQTGKGPAIAVAKRHIIGGLDDSDGLREFLDCVDCVAIEQEFTGAAAGAILARNAAKFKPDLAVIDLLSSKFEQKRLLGRLGIPTSPWRAFDATRNDPRQWLSEFLQEHPEGMVLKTDRGGYDGRGTFILRSGVPERRDAALAFIATAGRAGIKIYGEALVHFQGELAVVATRCAAGRFAIYPAVTTIHDQGICVEVQGGADRALPAAKAAAEAEQIARRIGNELKIVGTYAIEFFLSQTDGGPETLLVNEIAPRVHNSGHFSIEGAATSQFENHWRALLGLDLGSTAVAPFFGMINILGPEGFAGAVAPPIILPRPGVTNHWYGKGESNPRRKLGHVTVIAACQDELEQELTAIRSQLDQWGKSPSIQGNAMPQVSTAPALVGIIMGSKSDLSVMRGAAEALTDLAVSCEVRVVSAHRTPHEMAEYATQARDRGLRVLIAGAGGAAHLPGMVAAHTSLPVIGVPVPHGPLQGQDALLSIVQMPRGVPVATVAIGNATNAGILAAQILAAGDSDAARALYERLNQFKQSLREQALSGSLIDMSASRTET